MKILEEFEGVLERIIDDTAYVTLKQVETGEVLWGEYPAAEMAAIGIRERRRFKLKTIDGAGGVNCVLEAIPDKEITEEMRREIDEMLKLLGPDDAPQDDY